MSPFAPNGAEGPSPAAAAAAAEAPEPVGGAVEAARALVADWFPDARAAWLGGSAATGRATASSDLDVTVLLDGKPAPFRDQRHWGRWPVELFVQTDRSLAFYRASDQERRQPTMARLVGESVVLLDRDGSGARLRADCLEEVAAGPKPLTAEEIDALRYAVTSCCEDLADRVGSVASRDVTGGDLASGDAAGADVTGERAAVAVTLWGIGLTLLLGAHRHWTGTGKGLAREVAALDRREGTSYLGVWVTGLRAALDGDPVPLVAAADVVLDLVGGRLGEGYRLEGREG